jgi:hypothetical protein
VDLGGKKFRRATLLNNCVEMNNIQEEVCEVKTYDLPIRAAWSPGVG